MTGQKHEENFWAARMFGILIQVAVMWVQTYRPVSSASVFKSLKRRRERKKERPSAKILKTVWQHKMGCCGTYFAGFLSGWDGVLAAWGCSVPRIKEIESESTFVLLNSPLGPVRGAS